MSTVKKISKILMADMWFHIFASLSIFFITVSFFIPPAGVIDSSVFVGVGELWGFGALWEVHIAIKKGLDAKVTKDDITIEINNPDPDKN